jgi:oxygen-independent coproporphyrinogen-3 oxidase
MGLTEARPPEGLYVHFPFCVSLCPYCDFVVVAGAEARGPRNRVAALLAAVHAELALRAASLDERFGRDRPPLVSVYIGGGTPSLMAAGQVEALMEDVAARLGIAADAEVTLEANPGADELGGRARVP